MPSVSLKQRNFLYATKGSSWVHAHGFDVLDPAAKGIPRTQLANHMRKKKKNAKL